MAHEDLLTDDEVRALPLMEQVGIALDEKLGGDDGSHAYTAIEHLVEPVAELRDRVKARIDNLCACDGAGCDEAYARRVLVDLLGEEGSS